MDFTDVSVTTKTGFAAIGVTTNDFWNTCGMKSESLPYLQFVDGTPSEAGLTFSGTPYAYANGSSDPMYGIYLYTGGGDLTVTVTNLNGGIYDIYLYGHGNTDDENSVFQLSVNSLSYGSEATTNNFGWLSSVWQEGVQFVEFTNLSIVTGQQITITVEPGASIYSLVSGLQMANLNPSPVIPFVVNQPASQVRVLDTSTTLSVVAGGTAPLTYQWLFNNSDIPGATNSSYVITNITQLNIGSYTVLVSNAFGSTLSGIAVLTVLPALLATQTPDPSLYDANLMASITPYSDGTTVWFEWGLDTNYGNLTPATILQGTNALSISNLIGRLAPYTKYHSQAVASNVFGTVLGGDVSFTTVPKFVQVGTNADWSVLVLSADGRELAATLDGIVYISTNLGVTFTPTTGPGSVFAVSFNGATVLSVSGASIYASTNRGLTWTTNSAPAAFTIFAASSSAQNLVATTGSFYLYTSTNFGATWQGSTSPYNARTYGLASSADGSHLFGVSFFAPGTAAFFGSTNLGNTWASLFEWSGESRRPTSVACSANGAAIAVAGFGTEISIDGGASWGFDNVAPPTYPGNIAMSADGHQLVLTGDQGYYIYVSPDAGYTWYRANFPYINSVVMSSADGNTLAAFNGSIYLALPPPSQPLALSAATTTSNGMPIFQLTGQAGYSYTVQVSCDLLDWTNLATVVNTNGTVQFTDPASTNCKQRFYRAVAP